jgi:xylulose-5-phosphate/fructose-6-phosphate phosphoketolase
MDAYWRAANYLSVGQIYLLDNPLLKEPLKREDIKPRLLGQRGTTPLENLAAVDLRQRHVPELKVRVVNLMKLQPAGEHPHGLSRKEFDAIFTKDKPIIFAFRGYPWLIHRLTYRRTNHHNLHVRGYKEEGTTITPFDMAVLNQLDRFSLVSDVIDRVPKLGEREAYAQQAIREKLIDHKHYIAKHGDDMPEVRDWQWPGGATAGRARDTAADNV